MLIKKNQKLHNAPMNHLYKVHWCTLSYIRHICLRQHSDEFVISAVFESVQECKFALILMPARIKGGGGV